MPRETYKWDEVSHDLVTASELDRRRAGRKRDVSASTLFDKPVERGSWIYDRSSGEIVPASEYYARLPRRVLGPMIISDDLKAGVNGLWHPATGQRTDSKSHFRKMTRDSGCVEVGDENNTANRREIDAPGADIAQAFREYGL